VDEGVIEDASSSLGFWSSIPLHGTWWMGKSGYVVVCGWECTIAEGMIGDGGERRGGSVGGEWAARFEVGCSGSFVSGSCSAVGHCAWVKTLRVTWSTM